MRRVVCAALSVLCLGGAAHAPAADLYDLTIMTYNIYHGGHDHDPVYGRNLEWLQVIKSRNPDVLLIQEAEDWLPETGDYLSAYVDSLNAALPNDSLYMGYMDTTTPYLALITRLPLLAFEAYRSVPVDGDTIDLHHGFLHAVLDAWGEPLHIFDVHFKPAANRAVRAQEATALGEVLDGLPPLEKVWVCGDFNSYSPVDVEPGSPTEPDYDGGAPSAEETGWEPVLSLLDRGFEDAFRVKHPLDPGYTQNTESFYAGWMGPVRRVDFILRTPGNQWFPEVVEIVDDSLGDIGSDHYAVFARYKKSMPTGVNAAGIAEARYGLRVSPTPTSGPGRISFRLPSPGPLSLDLYSPTGRKVRSLLRGWEAAGAHELPWDGTDERGRALPSGVYFLRLVGPAGGETVRLIRAGSSSR